MRHETSVKPLLIVLSGPSGVGKDALISKLKKSAFPLSHITTVTTRAPRPNEKNNVDYHFISTELFQEMIRQGELLESANVYGNWYGVPREAVKQALDKGQDVIIKVDIQGAATIKKIVPEAVLIFVTAPSIEEIKTRLTSRHSEKPDELTRRLNMADKEIEQLHLFDYVVVNKADEIDRALVDIKAIITAEKCRVNPREVNL
ncbi:MAG: guanylate kinase [Chloroflexota bacterium]